MRDFQKAVIHYRSGTLLRARLRFFESNRTEILGEDLSGRPINVPLDGIKAIFFVREYEGEGHDHGEPPPPAAAPGLPVAVRFEDGEVIEGTVSAYPPPRPGFYLTPLVPGGNNRTIFVPTNAAVEVRPLHAAGPEAGPPGA